MEKKGRQRIRHIMKWNWQYYVMLLPFLIYYLVFKYGPMYGVLIAFTDYNIPKGILGSPWAEPVWKYFEYFFESPYAARIIGNTLKISFYKIAFGMIPPIILAIMINECKNKWFRKAIQTASYLPHFLSWVIIYGIMTAFFSQTSGLINRWLTQWGLSSYPFLTDPTHFQAMIVGTDLWKGLGWSAIIYLAAIAGIDTTLYEAAIIDGCSKLKRIWYITLPLLKGTFILQLILRAGSIMNAGFDQIYVIASDQVLGVAEILDTWVFKEGIQRMNYSLASAVGLLKSVIGLVLVLGTNKLARKWDEGLW